MSLLVLSANHHNLSINDVNSVSESAQDVSDTLAYDVGVNGWVTLSTCNRYELYLDADAEAASRIAAQLGPVDVMHGDDGVRHIYEVASGLDSMVIGEREIVSQVRTSLKSARTNGHTTQILEQVFQGALHTSRKVAIETDFSRSGRSLVGTALDMALAPACTREGGAPASSYPGEGPAELAQADPSARPAVPEPDRSDWRGVDVLLVGTGAYAGATVKALKDRGADRVRVWSQSQRAQHFAAEHGIGVAPELDLLSPQVIVLCRGTGSPVISAEQLEQAMAKRGPLVLIDLARSRDVEAQAKNIPGVLLIDLETIRYHVPAAAVGDTETAQQIIQDGLLEFGQKQAGRSMDPTIVGVRNLLAGELERELEKLPAGGEISAESASAALRRLSATMAHRYAESARRAAQEGRASEYHAAAELVFGAELPAPYGSRLEAASDTEEVSDTDSVFQHNTKENDVCPMHT